MLKTPLTFEPNCPNFVHFKRDFLCGSEKYWGGKKNSDSRAYLFCLWGEEGVVVVVVVEVGGRF